MARYGLPVAVDPCASPFESSLLRALVSIEKAKDTGRFNHPVVLSNGSAGSVRSRSMRFLMLLYCMSPDVVAVVGFRFH